MVDVTATGKGCGPAVRSRSRELYVLVEGDEWAHVEAALDSDAGYWARRFAHSSTGGYESRDRAVVPSAAELAAQGNRAAEGGGRSHLERVRGSQGETALGRSLGLP